MLPSSLLVNFSWPIFTRPCYHWPDPFTGHWSVTTKKILIITFGKVRRFLQFQLSHSLRKNVTAQTEQQLLDK